MTKPRQGERKFINLGRCSAKSWLLPVQPGWFPGYPLQEKRLEGVELVKDARQE
jgi:hypothetical protein